MYVEPCYLFMLHRVDKNRKWFYNSNMKKLLTLLLLALCSIAHAEWHLATVYGKDSPAGYIYYTSAVGTTDNEKLSTRLQFICSLKGGVPIVSIYWDKNIEANGEVVVSFVTDSSATTITSWTNDGELLYKPLASAPKVINAVKTGKIIKFRAQGTSTSYTTAFNVTGVDFTEFNAKCGTNI
jgi:hypothetical protein